MLAPSNRPDAARATAAHAAPRFRNCEGPVNDYAHVLSPEQASQLREFLLDQENKTEQSDRRPHGAIRSTARRLRISLNVAAQVGRLGQKQDKNGVLLVAAINDHKMRIEVGYGLEGALTDALSSQIIRNEIAPHFRTGDYFGGLMAGVTAIDKAIHGEYKANGPPTAAGRPHRYRHGAVLDDFLHHHLGIPRSFPSLSQSLARSGLDFKPVHQRLRQRRILQWRWLFRWWRGSGGGGYSGGGGEFRRRRRQRRLVRRSYVALSILLHCACAGDTRKRPSYNLIWPPIMAPQNDVDLPQSNCRLPIRNCADRRSAVHSAAEPYVDNVGSLATRRNNLPPDSAFRLPPSAFIPRSP